MTFGEQHAGLFFGREREIGSFLEQLREFPVMTVVGASGVGKSSFVQAGILPRLREQGDWHVFSLRPGQRPFAHIEARLYANATPEAREQRIQQWLDTPAQLGQSLREYAAKEQTHLLLFVDQLEELFTHVTETQVQRRFLEALCSVDDAQDPVRVVFTLRDDYLGRIPGSPLLQQALQRTMVLSSPSRDALQSILHTPLERFGYRWDDDALADEILATVEGESACLPMLQFTAQMLWERRDTQRKLLLREAYQAMGGVEGALATHADGVLAACSRGQQQVARAIFLRLVTVERTRKVLPLDSLLTGISSDAAEVVDHLVQARLLSIRQEFEAGQTAQAHVEIVHESLISTWTQLSRWLDQSREEHAYLAELEEATRLWKRRGARVEEAWEGETLQEALRMRRRIQENIPQDIDLFLQVGQKKEHKKRQQAHRTRGFFVILGLLVLAISWVGLWAFSRKSTEAQQQRKQAQLRLAQAHVESAWVAHQRNHNALARARLRMSLEIADSLSLRALWKRLQESPLLWEQSINRAIYHAAFSPTEAKVAVALQSGAMVEMSTDTLRMNWLPKRASAVLFVRYTPDGKRLVMGTVEGLISIWDAARSASYTLQGHRHRIRSLAFTADGKTMASACLQGKIQLWNLDTRAKIRTFQLSGRFEARLAIHPKGHWLAASDAQQRIAIWSLPTGQRIAHLPPTTHPILQLSYHPSTQKLIAITAAGMLLQWSPHTGKLQRLPLQRTKPTLPLGYANFSNDGHLLATWSNTTPLEIWETSQGRRIWHHPLQDAKINALEFSPNNQLLLAGGWHSKLSLWDLQIHKKPPPFSGPFTPENDLVVAPHGRFFATAGWEHHIRLWDIHTGHIIHQSARQKDGLISLAISSDGKLLAAGTWGGSILLWDTHRKAIVGTLAGHTGRINRLAFLPNQHQLISASFDKTLRRWDLTTQTHQVWRGHTRQVHSLHIHPTGKWAASAGWDHHIRLWDVHTGQTIRTFQGHHSLISSLAFSPDGRWLLSGSEDKTLRLWDRLTGQSKWIRHTKDRILQVGFHPQGRWIAWSLPKGVIQLLDRQTRKVRTLKLHQEDINAFRFVPKGDILLTTSDDKSTQAWRISDGQPVWRTPFVDPTRRLLATHRGWLPLGAPHSPPHTLPQAWRKAIVSRAQYAMQFPNTPWLCIHTLDGALELWNTRNDRHIWRHKLPHIRQIQTVPRGCLVRTDQQIVLYPEKGPHTRLFGKATAMHWHQNILWIGTNKQVHRMVLAPASEAATTTPHPVTSHSTTISPAHPTTTFPIQRPPHSILWTPNGLVLGSTEGQLEYLPKSTPYAVKTGSSKSYRGTLGKPITRLFPGPAGTLFLGFFQGFIEHRGLNQGDLLALHHVYGPVQHMIRQKDSIWIISALGGIKQIGLKHFTIPYCELLRQVWKQTPIIWEEGRLLHRSIPSQHPCRTSTTDPTQPTPPSP